MILLRSVTNMHQQFIQDRLLPIEYSEKESLEKKSKYELDEEMALSNYLKAMGTQPFENFRRASVLIPLVKNNTGQQWDVILTRRAKHLKHHPGEISFPGGRFENGDLDLQVTAKRETFEEIGIEAQKIEIIGRLPQQNTISQYKVTPYIGIVDPDYKITIDKNEVDEAFLVPLSFALDKQNHQRIDKRIKNQSYSYYVIQYNDYNIWGATARMLLNLSHRLSTNT